MQTAILKTIQKIIEIFLIFYFEAINRAAIHVKRVIIQVKDMQLINDYMNSWNFFSWFWNYVFTEKLTQ